MPVSLAEIVENKKREIEQNRASPIQNGGSINPPPPNGAFLNALPRNTLNLICELKPRSPAAGALKDVGSWRQVVDVYRRHAAALSVLTDEKYFGGSLELLRDVDQYVDLPLLRKDFIIDESQCYEARQFGADAVLLIVKILDDDRLDRFHKLIEELGMTPVVEVQSDEELARALKLSPSTVLINNRDLSTFEIDFATTERLAPRIPEEIITISASGIDSRSDIERLMPYCLNFLIGSALMRSANADLLLSELRGVPVGDYVPLDRGLC